MIVDLMVIAIVLLSAIFGARKGFVITIASFIQWFACIFAALFLITPVKQLLCDYTQTDEHIYNALLLNFGESVESSPAYNSVPDLFSGWIEDGTNAAASILAEGITTVILTVISFLLLVLAIRLICYALVHAFSKKHHEGIIGFADGLGGFVVGVFRGGIYVLIIFAVLIPILGIIMPDVADSILESMNNSAFAGEIYNNNSLLVFVSEFLS